LSLWLICCAISASFAQTFAQTEEPFRERLRLQTDKELYLAGELVRLKAIATDANGRPSDVSKVGYVELLNDSAPQVQIKLEMKHGVGEGAFSLPPSLPTGYYRLTAYTRYMRNEGEAVYYNRLLPVINPFIPLPAASVDSAVALSVATSFAPSEAPAVAPSVSTDRAIYPPRTTGELRIEGLPEDLHTLSVSIAGMDSLTPALIHYDDYKRTLAQQPLLPGEQEYPEYEGPIITGTLIDLSTGKTAAPTEKPTALLGFVGNRTQLFGGQINEQGEVRFFTTQNANLREVSTTVLPTSSEQYRVDIQSPFARHTYAPLPALPLHPAKNKALQRRSVSLQVWQTYTAEADSAEQTDNGEPLFFPGKPDWRYLLDEYTRFGTMAEVVIEFIPGLRFRKTDNNNYTLSTLTEERTGFTPLPSLVLLDGIPLIDHGLIYHYNPLLIKEIEVYKGKYVFGGTVFDGLAHFKTYRNDYPGLRLSGSTQLFSYEGTPSPRLFPTPVYRTEEQRNSRLPDYRHTLLWKPQIEPHPGQALIPFTTSDFTGDFRIIVEGLTRDGKRIHTTDFIRVE
ncbi:MAG: hypothetical protein LBB84_05690, partial [Tannerellaceae bacterium]|nr:hypothetical protein [Tannerellaceae bacterium]